MEMPRFNDDRHGQPYCHVNGMGERYSDTDARVNRVVKYDLCVDPSAAVEGAVRRATAQADGTNGDGASAAPPSWRARVQEWFTPRHYPSEPIFVPRPNATREDDGVVLVVALDGTRGLSYLLVLDATNMTTLATSYSPVVIPYDVHGQFITADEP